MSRDEQHEARGTHVGLWVTADGHIRQELLADGRYEEARGSVVRAYTGRYEVDGTHIEYWDDSGFTADGTFDGDVLHHAGYVFHRRPGGHPGPGATPAPGSGARGPVLGAAPREGVRA
jgi:hypothetical protein